MLCFNILPIYPLDGYRILKQFLLLIFDGEYTEDLLKYLSLIILLILIICFVIFKIYVLFAICSYLIIKVLRNSHQQKAYLDSYLLLTEYLRQT